MRKPCCDKEGNNKGAWSKQEDQKLIDYIRAHGEGCWRSLPKAAGLHRCGKSCRLRWINYLRPDIKRGNFAQDEEDLIIKLHALLGNRWSLIAGRLPGRTDNEVKNYWNSHIKKKLTSMGIDPNNHRLSQTLPRPAYQAAENNGSAISSGSLNNTSKLEKLIEGDHQQNDGVSDTAGSSLEEETSGSSNLVNLDLSIAFPDPPTSPTALETNQKNSERTRTCSQGESVTVPTLVLFR